MASKRWPSASHQRGRSSGQRTFSLDGRNSASPVALSNVPALFKVGGERSPRTQRRQGAHDFA